MKAIPHVPQDYCYWILVRRKSEIYQNFFSRPSIMALAKHIEASVSLGDLTAIKVNERNLKSLWTCKSKIEAKALSLNRRGKLEE